MKVFFAHISKNGGSSIRKIANADYGSNFHTLLPTTSPQELKQWIAKERVFISTELHGLKQETLETLLQQKNFYKFTISRDPIQRFRSFCAYSTKTFRHQGNLQGVDYWDLGKDLEVQVDLNFWLHSSLAYMKQVLAHQGNTEIEYCNQKLYFGVYSQWFVASMMSYPIGNRLIYTGENIYQHIKGTRSLLRKGMSARETIKAHTKNFYHRVGTTNKLDHLIEGLRRDGIFSKDYILTSENSTTDIQKRDQRQWALDSQLIAEFYSLLPEDFFFHRACYELSA